MQKKANDNLRHYSAVTGSMKDVYHISVFSAHFEFPRSQKLASLRGEMGGEGEADLALRDSYGFVRFNKS